MQRHSHDFGCEAEGVFYTCRGNKGRYSSLVLEKNEQFLNEIHCDCLFILSVYLKALKIHWSIMNTPLFVRLRTISVMQVYIHIKDSFIFLPQPEDPQHGVIHITETRSFIPERTRQSNYRVWRHADRSYANGRVHHWVVYVSGSILLLQQVRLLLGVVPSSGPVDGYVTFLVHKTLGCCQGSAPYCCGIIIDSLHHWTVITWKKRGFQWSCNKIATILQTVCISVCTTECTRKDDMKWWQERFVKKVDWLHPRKKRSVLPLCHDGRMTQGCVKNKRRKWQDKFRKFK